MSNDPHRNDPHRYDLLNECLEARERAAAINLWATEQVGRKHSPVHWIEPGPDEGEVSTETMLERRRALISDMDAVQPPTETISDVRAAYQRAIERAGPETVHRQCALTAAVHSVAGELPAALFPTVIDLLGELKRPEPEPLPAWVLAMNGAPSAAKEPK